MTKGSDPGEPLIPLVLPVTALPAGDPGEAIDQLDLHHVLRVLVAQLPLDAQPDRRIAVTWDTITAEMKLAA